MKLVRLIPVVTLILFWGAIALSQTILQGGDNIDNAFVIPSIPFIDSGTTTGYTDDYNGNCGPGGGAPDVVYSYTPSHNAGIWADLCDGWDYSNKLYIFKDSPDSIIACNIMGCSANGAAAIYECIPLVVGHTYYFVVDGNQGESGNYHLNIQTPSLPPPLSGSVTESGAGPIVGALIRVLREDIEVERDSTTEYGHYGNGDLLFLAPDTYTVEASMHGYITKISEPAVAGICQGEVILDFALDREGPPPIGSLTGVVRLLCDSLLAEGAIVMANATEGGIVYTDTTAPDGSYLMPEMQTVLYDVAAYKAGYTTQTQHSIQILSDTTIQLDLMLLPPMPGCFWMLGDINNDGHTNGLDVIYGVNYFKFGAPPPPFACVCLCSPPWFVAGDVNGSCSFNGLDITYLVSYFKGGPALIPCPDCPPPGR